VIAGVGQDRPDVAVEIDGLLGGGERDGADGERDESEPER
jgi:hypothetical protein